MGLAATGRQVARTGSEMVTGVGAEVEIVTWNEAWTETSIGIAAEVEALV